MRVLAIGNSFSEDATYYLHNIGEYIYSIFRISA
jgi:hypothetical protein